MPDKADIESAISTLIRPSAYQGFFYAFIVRRPDLVLPLQQHV